MTKALMQPPLQKGAMTVDEFCAWASIGRSKFYAEVAAGRVRIRKIGRKSVVTFVDAQNWLTALPVTAASGIV